ncbi:hypothetical protein M8C21_020904 [Ambrosia artemisiifolia]|uniref:Uncharacterized protein n=1 Tax=Ambrosia artemisiifolia TaxID=4212 RepID=A0AAD5CJL5_AMBAR|nr:hypothetical protein M8C21_001606 [Ambrosia artemisiifolia]KAI7741724.1 hypothetical protein M8C21_020904 [Ambrosia artemisiifolia]
MSDARDPSIKLLGKSIQSADDQKMKYMKGGKAFRYDGDGTEFGKNALANLRANPAAMSRSMKFHETS